MAEGKGKAKTEAEEEGGYLWRKIVELTQTAFRDGNLAEETTWQTVVLIPKGKGEFSGNRAGGGNLEIANINPSPPSHEDKTP